MINDPLQPSYVQPQSLYAENDDSLESKLHQLERVDGNTFIDYLLTNPTKFKALSDKELNRHFFLTNRRIAVAFPLQAQAANKTQINQVAILKSYHSALCRAGQSLPRWVFTKQLKAEDRSTNDNELAYHRCLTFDLQTRLCFIQAYDLDATSFYDMIKHAPIDVLDELHSIKLQIESTTRGR